MTRPPDVGPRGRETELLLACIRTALGTERAQPAPARLMNDVNWPRLVHTALQHGVMPLLYRTLAAVGPPAVPPSVLVNLRERFRGNAQRNLVLTAELLDLLALLQAHSIPALPLKGPVMAMSLYGDVALRQFTDIDILVRPQDVSCSQDLLNARGYAFRARQETSVAGIRAANELRVTLDLQWALAEARFRFPMDHHLWSRLECTSIGSVKVWQPDPSDQILILCGHPAKHSWSRLGWISDIAAFLRVHGNSLDWPHTVNRAGALGGERLLLLGLRLAADLLHATVPDEVLSRMRADRVVVSLAAEFGQRLFVPAGERRRLDGSYRFVEAGRVYIKSRERLADKIAHARYLMRILVGWCRLTPNERDRAVTRLPSALTFLYYLIRPYRLAKKYGPRIVQRG